MSQSNDTVETTYGRMDKAALEQVRNTYDTTVLPRMVDQLDKILAGAREGEGLRDMLLQLHGMAHNLVAATGSFFQIEAHNFRRSGR